MAGALSTTAGAPDAQRPEPPSLERMAAAFPQLEIIELIGQGGMGAVYKARQKQLDRVVALKILPPGVGGDPAFAERFTREARALAKLLHPNIVTLFEFGQADGIYYLLMEYVDGLSLRRLLETGRVAPREALAIVPQICDALQFAHDQGIVHRDIKPENILLDRRGRVKVADFGLAKIVGGDEPAVPAVGGAGCGTPDPLSNLTGESVMGTPQYMAPEQAEHPGEVDHRADIYALGVVFYQMLTGQLPREHREPPSKQVRIDVRLDEVVLRALEKKPELRYQQVSEMKTRVETIAMTPPSPGKAEPGSRKYSKRSLLVVGAVALVSVVALVFLGERLLERMFVSRRVPATQEVSLAEMAQVEQFQRQRATNEFASYPVNRAWPDIGDRLDFSRPETAAASAMWHIWGGTDDPATVIGKAFLDVPKFPPGSITISSTPEQKQVQRDSRVDEVVVFRHALAGVISRQRTNGVDRFVTMVAGLRKDQWRLMVWDLEEHAKPSRAEAEHQFRADAPRLFEDFQKLPDEPQGVVALAGNELAANLGEMAKTMMNSMKWTMEAVSTQVSNQLPALAGQVQNLAQSLANRGTTPANPQSATVGQTATFQVVANGSAPLSYQWSFNNPTNTALEFRWVARENETNAPGDEFLDPSDRAGKEKLRLLKEVVLNESDVAGAAPGTSGADAKEISVLLSDEGARKFSAATAANVGRRLAIVWRGRVVCAPVIRTPISAGRVSITGMFSDTEASQLMEALNHRPAGDPHVR